MTSAQSADKSLAPLERDEEQGWILEGDKRVITFRIKSFQKIEEQLNVLLGPIVACVVLLQMGLAIGRTAMSYSKDRIHSDGDLGTVFDDALKTRGWGRVVGLSCKPANARNVYVFKLKGIPQTHDTTSSAPMCHMMRGIIAGWVEAYFDQKGVDCKETECESTGKPFCIFEVALEKTGLEPAAFD